MRLNFDARARAILRRLPVVNVYSLVELALLALLATQCARLAWAIATPVSPLGEWRPAEPAVPASASDLLAGFDPFFRITGQPAAASVTALSLKLFGTRIDEAMGRGSAIIAGPDGMQKSISVGEEVAPGVVLRAVAFDHVSLERGGALEDLFLDQSGGQGAATPQGSASEVAPPAGVPLTGSRPASQTNALTLDAVRADIGFVPRVDGGRVSGLTVRPQGSGTAFRAIGLRDGDVVTAIGGRPVTGDPSARLADVFSGGGPVALTVERGGQTLALSIPATSR